MNPAHRDRIAFVRVCSGKFERGMNVTLPRTGKAMKLSQSTQFLAETEKRLMKQLVVILSVYTILAHIKLVIRLWWVNNNSNLNHLPQFTPEIFVRVTAKNVMKQKHFHKGIHQLVQEGAIQLL